jgi:glycosyltransferase involved in cell wall biosynthesis
MKLNWFSPLPPARTGIADYTLGLLPTLSERAEVTLWTDQTNWDEALERSARVRTYHPDRVPWEELNRSDLSFYNIGNNHPLHASIWQVSRRSAGIVILHDIRLHDFFENLYRGQWRDKRGYLTQMKKYYGQEGLRAATEFLNAKSVNLDLMAERYPLTPLALENSLGALVHTREAFDELRLASRWPVEYAPLPGQCFSERSEESASRSANAPYRLIVFGHMGRNRRLDALLEALAQLPERNHFQLDIYGQIDDSKTLRKRIHKLDLRNTVRVHGYAPEAELDKALNAASLAINLRYPTMGEASASQLRIWAYALPSLVTKVGWYSSLSEETVAHVRPEHEVADIQSHLKGFLKDPAHFARMGEQGLRILKQEHHPEMYVRTILALASNSRQFSLRKTAYDMATRAGTQMSAWVGQSEKDDGPRRVAEKIHALTSTTNQRKHDSSTTTQA